jgi:hypothetical protein
MKKLSSLAAVCVGLLFVSACVGLMTAGPSAAQGALRPADVNVINTPNVNVVSLPAVQIGGTPTVNVGNTPSVNVNSLPAVQVGNGAGNPVPVSVTNLSTAGPGFEVRNISFLQTIQGFQRNASDAAYTVPANRILVLTQVSFSSLDNPTPDWYRQSVLIADPSGAFNLYMPVDEATTFATNQHERRGTRQVEIYAGPGAQVILKSDRGSDHSGSTHTHWNISGRLIPASAG